MTQNYKKNKKIPAFLQKLYAILEESSNECAIMWASNKVGFAILNEDILTKTVLPKYFKHSNYSSFIRQLNMYDFHKIRKGNLQNYFHHDKFIQGDLNSISQIRRKPQKKKAFKNISNKNLTQNQRYYSESQMSRQQINGKRNNKSQITLNSVHTIKAKSEESIILARDQSQRKIKGEEIYYQEYESENQNRFSRIHLNHGDSFQNEEQMDDQSSKMSINNQIQSKNLIQQNPKEILIPSINNIFAFISPYQLANFGLFI